jgi:hypothetical protein
MSVSMQDGVTEIGDKAFSGCSKLSSIVIPGSVTTIGENAFMGCLRMTSATISEGVEEIGTGAFENCYKLESLTIPGSVTRIGEKAFYFCSALPEVVIPESVTEIGIQAFYGCSNLASVEIQGTEVTIGDSAFSSNPSVLSSISILCGFDEQVFAEGNSTGITFGEDQTFTNASGATGTVLYNHQWTGWQETKENNCITLTASCVNYEKCQGEDRVITILVPESEITYDSNSHVVEVEADNYAAANPISVIYENSGYTYPSGSYPTMPGTYTATVMLVQKPLEVVQYTIKKRTLKLDLSEIQDAENAIEKINGITSALDKMQNRTKLSIG